MNRENRNSETDPPLIPLLNEVDDEFNLIDLIYPIYKQWKFLVIFCFIIVAGTFLWTRGAPKIYEAKVVILPESYDKKGGSEGQLRAASREQFGVSGISGVVTTEIEVLIAQLKSKEVASSVLNRFNYYYIKGIQKPGERNTVKSFANKLELMRSSKNPTVSIVL